MANDKVYTDYLMHGRTKGSKNGISTTKGYTAIGQRAKGRYINGRYVYDTIPLPGGNAADGRSEAISRWHNEHRKESTAKIPNWQNEANKTASIRNMINKWETGEINEGFVEGSRANTESNPRIRNKKISERKAKEYAQSRTSVISPNKGKKVTYNTPKSYGGNSDIGNAIADAKEDAKKAFKEAKADAKQTYVNLKSKLKSKFKKKKK